MAVNGTPAPAPLIVTATLPAEIFAWADRLRRAHFPPERNHLPAHVTLFHALPPSAEGEIGRLLASLASDPPPPARLAQIISLGSGTALLIESPAMLSLREMIAERFHGMLSAQDAGRPRLHITIQNKVTSREAKALQAVLAADFQPRSFLFAGLGLDRYRGGPWEEAGRWRFRGAARRA